MKSFKQLVEGISKAQSRNGFEPTDSQVNFETRQLIDRSFTELKAASGPTMLTMLDNEPELIKFVINALKNDFFIDGVDIAGTYANIYIIKKVQDYIKLKKGFKPFGEWILSKI